MTTNFRTQLLLGFTVLAGTLSGCIIETTSGGGPPSAACLENQYFNVRWGVEQSLGVSFTCQTTPPSTVFLTTNTGTELEVGKGCQDGRTCSGGAHCNWLGSTASGVPEGTKVISALLINATDNTTVLSTVDDPAIQVAAIPRCGPAQLGFLFPI